MRIQVWGFITVLYCSAAVGCNRTPQGSVPADANPGAGEVKGVTAPLPAGATDREPAQREALEYAALQRGTWLCVEAVDEGTKRTDPDLLGRVNMRFTFSADGSLENRSQAQVQKGSYRIFPDKRPKELDLTMDGKAAKCLYSLEGDVLALAIGDEANRPAEVALPSGSKWSLMIFRRLHPEN